jgi:hypothetical protein
MLRTIQLQNPRPTVPKNGRPAVAIKAKDARAPLPPLLSPSVVEIAKCGRERRSARVGKDARAPNRSMGSAVCQLMM